MSPLRRDDHTIGVLLAALFCVVSADKGDIQRLKAEAARKKACLQDCAKVQYSPVCAGKQGEKPKSFGSQCVLNNYNCENNDVLTKIGNGVCPGSDGVRLS